MTPTDPLEAARKEAWNVLLRVMQDEGIVGRKRQRIEDAARGYALATPRPAGDLPLRRWTAGKWTEDHDR